MNTFKLTIDGIVVEAKEGMTVLQAARASGIFIPSLCAHKDLSPYGACRLCIVEIDGLRGTPTSCTTPAAAGMVVRTNSASLSEQRQRTLELMLSGHPAPCLTCDSREDCENTKKTPAKSGTTTRCGTCSNRPDCGLRTAALGNFTREMKLPVIYSASKIEKSGPFIDRDHNLCVLCGICYRVCEKVHGRGAINIIRRGKDAKIASAFDKEWSMEECTFCGACVDECPTATLSDRWSKWYGAEDKIEESTCPICPKHCRIGLRIKDGKLIGTQKMSLDKQDALCAIGRFAYPQILNAKTRLVRPYAKIGAEIVPTSWAETVEACANILEDLKDKKALIISSEMLSQETRAAVTDLVKALNADFVEMPVESCAENLPRYIASKIEAKAYHGALVFGNFITADLAKNINRLIIADFVKTPAQKFAEVVMSIGVLCETSGTIIKPNDEKIYASAVIKPSLMQRPLAGILAEVLGKIKALHTSPSATKLVKFTKDPINKKSDLPHSYFGHLLADFAPDLEAFGLPSTPPEESGKMPKEGYEIIEKRLLAPNFHLIKVRAPEMAKYVKPGQFAILMATMHSERSPFTLADWNAEEGWVEFVVEEVGRSSSELGALKTGDKIANLSGPLGSALNLADFDGKKNVLLLGGCYGIAAIYPLAKALKSKGLNVTCAIEASSEYMLFYEKELKAISDKFVILTRDGTKGLKGGAADYFRKNSADYDCAISIGCVFMMKQCQVPAKENAEKIMSLCALNPIMVDGTGMCGACRVSVANETKFACVDGPFFKLDKVDFDELAKRRTAYTILEVDALPRHKGGKCHS